MSAGPLTLDQIGVAVPATRPKTSPAPQSTVSTSLISNYPATALASTATGTPAKTAPAPVPFQSGFCGHGPICRDLKYQCKGIFTTPHLVDVPDLHCECSCHPQTKVATTL